MKIKDLPEGHSLHGVCFVYPKDGRKYYWFSQWRKGVWGKKRMTDETLLPLFVDDLKEALEWEVAQ